MILPCLHRIFKVCARCFKNRIPKFFHAAFLRIVCEYFVCPAFRWDSDDRPAYLIRLCVAAVFAQRFPGCFLEIGDPLGFDPFEQVRACRYD
ncbi:Uncharacterised protein [Mycobacteroides abscessus subsp. abscessus]|nr:Uncharacterised protein [Mycobacteroides abscessus subsp. abscessus]